VIPYLRINEVKNIGIVEEYNFEHITDQSTIQRFVCQPIEETAKEAGIDTDYHINIDVPDLGLSGEIPPSAYPNMTQTVEVLPSSFILSLAYTFAENE